MPWKKSAPRCALPGKRRAGLAEVHADQLRLLLRAHELLVVEAQLEGLELVRREGSQAPQLLRKDLAWAGFRAHALTLVEKV